MTEQETEEMLRAHAEALRSGGAGTDPFWRARLRQHLADKIDEEIRKAFLHGTATTPPRPPAFALLDLDPATATEGEIVKAWRARAFRAHPDRGGSDAAMIQLNAAKQEAIAYVRNRR